jgi:hypothetical protein
MQKVCGNKQAGMNWQKKYNLRVYQILAEITVPTVLISSNSGDDITGTECAV